MKQKNGPGYLSNSANLSFGARLFRDLKVNKWVYVMAIPVVAYYLVFCYYPMYGALMAFQNFRP